jgi:hypothetical protein
MASNAAVNFRPVITNDHLKTPWAPDVKNINGQTFLQIDKWSRQLCMFVCGAGLNLSKAKKSTSINCLFLEDLQRRRTAACDEAVADAYGVDDAFQEGPPKKKRARKAKEADRDIAPSVVAVRCPEVKRLDLVLPATTIHMLFGVKNNNLWVELSAENLEYLRHGILASVEAREFGRHWKSTENDEGALCEAEEEATVAIADTEAPVGQLPEEDKKDNSSSSSSSASSSSGDSPSK